MSDTTFATPKARITYSAYPQYEEPKKVCGNCKFWNNSNKSDWGGCLKLPESSDLFSIVSYSYDGVETHKDFGCILWEAKESDVVEGE